jgi:hypothetical protein
LTVEESPESNAGEPPAEPDADLPSELAGDLPDDPPGGLTDDAVPGASKASAVFVGLAVLVALLVVVPAAVLLGRHDGPKRLASAEAEPHAQATISTVPATTTAVVHTTSTLPATTTTSTTTTTAPKRSELVCKIMDPDESGDADLCDYANKPLTFAEFTVTLGGFDSIENDRGVYEQCATVTVVNGRSSAEAMPVPSELGSSSGTTYTLEDRTLGGGTIAPGATRSGMWCAPGSADVPPGEFFLLAHRHDAMLPATTHPDQLLHYAWEVE